ncbi:MAG: helix-turn-helix transcriptional regulator [Lentisphaeria bacterium]|nr:helix-turn-helix transcriptional regulator [Lentisphaeria bacterium]
MTQKELAEKVNVDQSMICQIERGTKTPSLPLSVEIAEALGCDIHDLFKETK